MHNLEVTDVEEQEPSPTPPVLIDLHTEENLLFYLAQWCNIRKPDDHTTLVEPIIVKQTPRGDRVRFLIDGGDEGTFLVYPDNGDVVDGTGKYGKAGQCYTRNGEEIRTILRPMDSDREIGRGQVTSFWRYNYHRDGS